MSKRVKCNFEGHDTPCTRDAIARVKYTFDDDAHDYNVCVIARNGLFEDIAQGSGMWGSLVDLISYKRI